MKCIVLGAGGQLGREWMDQLSNSNLSLFNLYKGFGSDQADITERDEIATLLDAEVPDVVINCAAYTKVDEAEEQRELAEQVNSIAVKSLAEQCSGRNIKLVHYSTDYIFPGNKEDRQRFPQGYPEDHETSPVNWYGATKLKGEKAIRQSGAAHLIIRVSWLCGAHGSNFVKTMLRLADEQNELNVVNDQWGSPTFTENVVLNTLSLLQENKEGIFNITSDGIITWYDLACEIFGISGKEIQVNAVSSDAFQTKATRPRFSKLDTSKLAQVKGAAIIPWKEGLNNLLEKLKSE